MVNDILFVIRDELRTLGFSNIMNGHVKDSNAAYYNGFRTSKADFPWLFNVIISNDWFLKSWDGKIFPSKVYSPDLPGGRLVFNEETKITLKMNLDRLDLNDLKGFKVQSDEFESMQEYSFVFKFHQKEETRRKFTGADLKKIGNSFRKEFNLFKEDMEKRTRKQVQRRYDEMMQVAPEIALRYASDEFKEVFLM